MGVVAGTQRLAVLAIAGWTLLAQSPIRVEPVADAYRILVRGQTTEFEVRLVDADGAPVAGREVLFVAPQQAARGSWAEHDESKPWLYRALTDGEGRARGSWTASERQGPYLLSVMADGETAQLQFAVSNVETAPETAVAAEGLRQEWIGRLELDGTSSQVHGPFYLASNSELWGNTTALQGEEFYFSSPTPHWLIWVDDNPRSRYGHAGRFVLVNAESGESQIVAQRWWPLVWWPQAESATTVYPPYLGAHDLLPDPDPKKDVTVVRIASAADKLAAKPDPDACAIVIYGSDENGMRRDSLKMAGFFRDDLKIPEERIFTNKDDDGDPAPAKPSDVDRLVAEMCKSGCKKVYVYISSHGSAGTFKLANESEKDGNSAEDSMGYTYLATRIRECGESMNAQFILDACASGTAIRDLHTTGLDGAVFAGADLNGETRFNYFGGYFTDGLIDAWREDGADQGSDGADLQEAFDHLLKNGDEDELFGHPITSPLVAGGDRIRVNNIGINSIADPNQNPVTITIRRPAGTVGAVSGSVSIPEPEDGKTVAIVLGGDSPDRRTIAFPEGVDAIEVTLRGVAEGTTTYLVALRDEQQKQYRGRATIRVGAGFTITPSNAAVESGQTAQMTLKRDALAAEADGAISVQITPSDEASARIARPDALVELSADELEKQFAVQTLYPGLSRMKVQMLRETTREMLFELTSRGFVARPESIEIAVGETKAVAVVRYGYSTPSKVTYATSSGGALIASLSPGEPAFAPGRSSLELSVVGRAAGTVTYTLADDEGRKARLAITVKAAPAPTCITRGTFDAVFVVTQGQGHAPFFNLNAAAINFSASGTQGSITSNQPNLPAASGTYSSACEFNATGRATLVGMPNITFEYRRVKIDRPTGKIEGEYGAGLNNDLPGAYPIWYRFTGTLRPGTGQ